MTEEFVFRKVPMREVFGNLAEGHRRSAIEYLKKHDQHIERGILTLTKKEHEELMGQIQKYTKAENKEKELKNLLELLEKHINNGKLLEYEMDDNESIPVNPEFVRYKF